MIKICKLKSKLKNKIQKYWQLKNHKLKPLEPIELDNELASELTGKKSCKFIYIFLEFFIFKNKFFPLKILQKFSPFLWY
jgi:hypothetical protein